MNAESEAHGEPYGSREDDLYQQATSDEEAQLLRPDQFDYQESEDAESQRPPPRDRPKFLQRLSGPDPPRIQSIKPFFPSIQQYPVHFLDRFFASKKRKFILLTTFLLLWVSAFSIPLATGSRALKDGSDDYVLNLDCVDTLWRRKNFCGLDGLDCRPFTNSSFAFRCPANCAGVRVLNPRAVGPLDVNYRPLVIGDSVYRPDSFICGSAIHAGVVTDSKGGCGRVRKAGGQEGFSSVRRNGIESIPFDSYFPSSFDFSSDEHIACSEDPRQVLLYISLFFTIVFSLFTTSPSLQFFIVFTALFAHVGLVSDPPGASHLNTSPLPDHISRMVGRFLPAAFCAVIIYQTSVSRALKGLEAQLEKVLLWLGGFWFGALSNYTLDWIPISRLTAHDLQQQAGAKVALAVIICILTAIICQQVYTFWLEGRVLHFLALYGLFILGIVFFVAMPNINLRIHHYILALLLLPGTSVQTRSSLLYQGILLGLFVNGIARWGFDSLLQTSAALRGDALFDGLVPAINASAIESTPTGFNITFSWEAPPTPTFDGISVLVNDVERYRRFFPDTALAYNFTWTRLLDLGLPEYFRFAYMRDGTTMDYTGAGTWFANGSWAMKGS
ncbi:hypothetical protein BGZ61DRAFT_447042 [Ilyonectria robusta]|uniref:uncharacterized protein n=1 Tax=Ilyonectria robusta TaxID=1079257 RepID=UPI001E8D4421|nr:uncharacterized protein BGZ61DRAFT_447042 [Ilyonectria robusta]KAH8729829.1 hypothetical protein BGZ61DRAFT_447042 [Ilyonectria robusta]